MAAIRLTRAGKHSYAFSGSHEYVVQHHDGLTWQDRPYWTVTRDGKRVVRNLGQERSRRFRTLAEVREFIKEGE